MTDESKKPSIEFDLPESLKTEPPPAPSRAVANALAMANTPTVAAAINRMQELSAAEILRPDVERMDQIRSALTTAQQFGAISTANQVVSLLGKHDPVALAAALGVGAVSLVDAARALSATGASFSHLHRSVLGPLADLRASGALAHLEEVRAYRGLGSSLTAYEDRFTLPEITSLPDIFRRAGAVPPELDYVSLARQIRTPWLDTLDAVRSASAFADLQGLGLTVRTFPPFADTAATSLRALLGDFRDPITWPTDTNLIRRSEFYLERGFRPALTDFPPTAFEQSLDIAGLDDGGDELEEGDYLDLMPEGTEGQSAFLRTNRAHMLLTLFEVQLRAFIDSRLTQAFGADWPKQKLPNGMYDRWREKRETAEKKGHPSRPIIDYADFTDYSLILTKRDLWPAFQLAFTTPESVRESFNRLHMPRIETMHARPLSLDDVLFMRVEIKRLRKAML